MSRRWVVAALVLLAAGLAAVLAQAGGESRPNDPPKSSKRWERVFVDHFDRAKVGPRWSRYHGQPGGNPGGWWEPTHAVVRRGALELQAYRDPRYGNRWVSAGVTNSAVLKQKYGKYLVRFRMEGGHGVAGAVLLWPVADHWPPEIDFAEHGGRGQRRDSMAATLHYGAADHRIRREVKADFRRWHTMGVEWTPRRLVYLIDGRRWGTVRSRHVPSEPMELAIQTEAGTCGDRWRPCPDASTPERVTMYVDWVAAYRYRR